MLMDFFGRPAECQASQHHPSDSNLFLFEKMMDKAKNNAQFRQKTHKGRVAPGTGKSAQVDAKETTEAQEMR